MAEIGTEKRGHVQLEVSSSSDGIAVARRGSGTNQGNGKNVATGEVENNINHIFIIQRHTVSMMVCLFSYGGKNILFIVCRKLWAYN